MDEKNDKKILSLISLCARAGLLTAGEEKCERALRSGKAKLVIISRDASENTKKKFVNKAFFYSVPVMFFGQKEQLGKLTGAGFTSSICVTDLTLGRRIKDATESSESPGGI